MNYSKKTEDYEAAIKNREHMFCVECSKVLEKPEMLCTACCANRKIIDIQNQEIIQLNSDLENTEFNCRMKLAENQEKLSTKTLNAIRILAKDQTKIVAAVYELINPDV
jgi:hypothetical protein